MAYKFQLGSAILSGSTKFEEAVEVAGGLKLSGVDDTALDVSADSFLFRDSDGTMKRDSMADYATAIAGDGLAASSGVLAVGVDDSTIETDSDALRIKDNGVTLAKLAGITRGSIILGDSSGDPSLLAKGTAAQFLQSDGTDPSYVSISGDATVAAGGALTIAAEAVHSSMMNDDAISGHTELAHADILDADEMLISDGGILKRVGVDSLRDHFFGVVSGDATIADGGALTIGANAVQTGMVHDDVADELAGVGLSAASGVMAVDLNELTAADLASGDFLAFVDSDGSNATKKESVDDLATLFAGAGLAASSAVLSIQVSGAIKVASDKVGISGSFAGDGIKFLGGADSISSIELDVNELPGGAVADGDFFAFVDAGDNTTKKEAVADLATLFAGGGLVAASSVLAVNPGAGLEINSDAVRAKVASNGGLTRAAGVGNDELAMNMNSLDAAAVDVGNDSIAIVDANDSNKTKKESIADLMTAAAGVGLSAASGVLALDASELSAAAVASGDQFVFQDATDDSTKKESIDDIATFMAGTGLTAVSGVLNARLDVAAKADGDTLAAGINYFADLTSNAGVTLPASPAVGDTVTVKAKGLASAVITISKAGSQTIDGEASVIIESPFGAVTMVYVASNDWRLV